MSADWLVLFNVTIFVSTAAMLASGLYLWLRLRTHGGLELSLAHVVADPSRRRVLVGGLTTIILAFMAIAVTGALASVWPVSDAATDTVNALLFAIGAAGVLVLIANALRPSPLTLREEWTLAEAARRVAASSDLEAGASVPPGPYADRYE